MDHYSWLVALLWRFELFTSSRRHHHQNRSTGDQGTPFYLSKWSNVRWHPINLVETSGFYTEKTPKNMDRTNEANRFLAGWPAVNSLSQRGKLGSVLWNPSCALAPDMDHEIAQMSETWSNWLLRACSSICRCLQIWNWTWQHRPKPSIGNTAPAACNHGIPSNKFPPKDWRGSDLGVWGFQRVSTTLNVPHQRSAEGDTRISHSCWLLFASESFGSVALQKFRLPSGQWLGPLDTRTDPEK